MYDKLVKVLRETDFSDGCPCAAEPMCASADCIIAQAADAIEELNKRVPKVPHGDLIDRNALRAEVKKHATPSDAWVFSLIRTAPTVIPASPAEEGDT